MKSLFSLLFIIVAAQFGALYGQTYADRLIASGPCSTADNPLCLTGVDDPLNALGNSPATSARMFGTIGVAGTAFLEVGWSVPSTPGEIVSVVFESEEAPFLLLSAGVIEDLSVTLNGPTGEVDQRSSVRVANVQLLDGATGGSQRFQISFFPEQSVTSARIEFGGLLELLDEVRVIQASHGSACPPAIASNVVTFGQCTSTNPNPLNCLLQGFVVNPDNAVNGERESFAELTIPIGLLTAVSFLEVSFDNDPRGNDVVMFELSSAEGAAQLLSAGLLESIQLQLNYVDGAGGALPPSVVEELEVLDLQALQVGNETRYFLSIQGNKTVNDRITSARITVNGGLLSLLTELRVHQVFSYTPQVLPLNLTSSSGDIVCPGESTTLTVNEDDYIDFIWSTGETTRSIEVSDTTPTYSVTATDIYGCMNDTVFNFSNFPENNVGIETMGPLSLCDGEIIRINAESATNITYSWAGPDPDIPVGSVEFIDIDVPGTYTLTTTDINGCSNIDSIAVIDGAFSASISVDNPISCSGNSDGILSATATPNDLGRTPNFSYLWSTGEVTPSISNLSEGFYVVNIRDQETGCTKSLSFTLNANRAIKVGASLNQPYCGTSSGSIDLNVSASIGTGLISYNWSSNVPATGGQRTTPNVTGLTSGRYTVQISDGVCDITKEYFLSDIFGPEISANLTDANCTADNGAIELRIDGVIPAPKFNILWLDNNTTTANRGNLAPGDYTVQITDTETGCAGFETFTINRIASGLVLTTNVTAPDPNSSNGAISVNATGGSNQYIYQWSTNETTQTINNIGFGVYEVTVTDALFNGCRSVAQIPVSEQGSTGFNYITDDVTCERADDGSVSYTPGAVSPFTVEWSTGKIETEASAAPFGIFNLRPGSYAVTTTINGLKKVQLFTVKEVNAISVELIGRGLTCFNQQGTGAVIARVIDPTPGANYEFSLNGGTPQVGTGANFSGLNSGTYNFSAQVQGNTNCQVNSVVNIMNPDSISVMITDVQDNTSCAPIETPIGSIDIDIAGGTPPYSVQWSNGATSQDLSGLTAQNYSVTVTDINNCPIAVADTFVGLIPKPDIDLDVTVTDADCNNSPSGAIETIISPSGNYSFRWSNGSVGRSIFDVPAGEYFVTISNNDDFCEYVRFFTVGQESFGLEEVVVNSECGEDNGSIQLIPRSGSGFSGTTYVWSNGDTTDLLTDLSQGDYQYTVTSTLGTGNQCRIFGEVKLDNVVYQTADPRYANGPIVPDVRLVSIDNNTACNTSDGEVKIAVANSADVSFMWSDGSSDINLSNVAAGEYFVTVSSNESGCYSVESYQVENTNNLVLAEIVNEPTCGTQEGSIDLTVTGGSGDYSYIWTTGSTDPLLDGLVAGVYGVTVTDNISGCTEEASYSVTSVNALVSIGVSKADVTCFGGGNGSASIVVTGTSPVNYYWSNGSNNPGGLSSLNAGTYSVTVTDTSDCEIVQKFEIFEPQRTQLSIDRLNIRCSGETSARISVDARGGTPSYTYNWSSANGFSSTGAVIQNLSAGTYILNFSDLNGCGPINVALPIIEPTDILLQVDALTTPSCAGNEDGRLELGVIGGNQPYTYVLGNRIQDSSVFVNVGADNYNISVLDANLCSASLNFNVPNTEFNVTAVRDNVSCAGRNDGSIELNPSFQFGTPTYSYTWNNGAETKKVSELPTGTYLVHITDENTGCFTSRLYNVEEQKFDLQTVVDNSKWERQESEPCTGSFGSIEVIPSFGGVLDYSYSWSNGQNSNRISNLSPGLYTVTVSSSTDTDCSVVKRIGLSHAATLQVDPIINPDNCVGGTGSIAVNVSGGEGAINYGWNVGSTSSSISGIEAGEYILTVTDERGCTAVEVYELEEVNSLDVSVTSRDTDCQQDDGSAEVVGPDLTNLTFDWITGETTARISDLPSGFYSVNVTNTVTTCSRELFVGINDEIFNPAGDEIDGNLFVEQAVRPNSDNARFTVTGTESLVNVSYMWSDDFSNMASSSANVNNGTVGVIVNQIARNCRLHLVDSVALKDVYYVEIDGVNESCDLSNPGGTLTASVSGGTEPYFFNWNSGLSNIATVNNIGAGVYQLEIEDIDGYQFPKTIVTNLVKDVCLPFDAPTIFEPNGDGFGDVLKIDGLNRLYPNNRLVVYNRWGNVVYEAQPYQNDWDGTFNGNNLPDATYFIVLTYDVDNESEGIYKSFLEIQR